MAAMAKCQMAGIQTDLVPTGEGLLIDHRIRCSARAEPRETNGHRSLFEHRQLDGERRAASLAIAVHRDRAGVELDNVPGDRQAEPETALARLVAPEAIEDVGQELRANADTIVANTDCGERAATLCV